MTTSLLDTKISRHHEGPWAAQGRGQHRISRAFAAGAAARHGLPVPQSDNPAKKAANWPDDPDIKQAKQRKEAERKRKSFEPGVDDKPLPPSQMGKEAGTAGNKGGEASRTFDRRRLPPAPTLNGLQGLLEMFGTGLWAPKEEYKPFTGEPARAA